MCTCGRQGCKCSRGGNVRTMRSLRVRTIATHLFTLLHHRVDENVKKAPSFPSQVEPNESEKLSRSQASSVTYISGIQSNTQRTPWQSRRTREGKGTRNTINEPSDQSHDRCLMTRLAFPSRIRDGIYRNRYPHSHVSASPVSSSQRTFSPRSQLRKQVVILRGNPRQCFL